MVQKKKSPSKKSALRFGRKVPPKPEPLEPPPPKRDILKNKSLVQEIVEDVKDALVDFLQNPEAQKWFTPPEICVRLRVTERTLYTWQRQGMPFMNFGHGHRKFYLPDVLAWLAEREAQTNRIQRERREMKRLAKELFNIDPRTRLS